MENILEKTLKDLFGFESKFESRVPRITGLILEYGKSHVTKGISTGGHAQMEEKNCFANSLLKSLSKNWQYCQGYAMREGLGLPIEHAWCWDGEKIIDLTWRGSEEETFYYYGIHLDADVASKFAIKTSHYGLEFWRDRDGKSYELIKKHLEGRKNESL